MRKVLLSIISIFLTTNFSYTNGYWHRVYDGKEMSLLYNVVGDSNTIYIDGIDGWDLPYIKKSTNKGKTWDLVYSDKGPKFPPYANFQGLEYPAPGNMYLLFSEKNDWGVGTSIKKLDERIGKVVDSIVIETKTGFTNIDDGAFFEMTDSVNGILCSGSQLSVTRDGWKTFKHFDINNGYYNEDSTEYVAYFQHCLCNIKLLSKDTLMCYCFTLTDAVADARKYGHYVLNVSYFILEEGDTTFKYEPITKHGINLKISPDSVVSLNGNKSLRYKHPIDFAYLNDSTWVYVAEGKKTGNGQCYTLEIFKTTNKGKYFYQVCNMDVNAFGLHRIKFKDDKNGLAVGNSVVLRTTDGGETWFEDTEFYEYNCQKIPVGEGIWNIHINYVNDMEFIGVFGGSCFKYETEFGAGAIDEKQKSHLVYPNPAHSGDMVTIDYPQYINGEILIHDIYGKHIDKVNFIGNSFRLKEGIPKGTYFIVISSNGEVLGREKFVVTE